MNFLAHLYLSGDNPKITVGNFIGDFVKGAQIEIYDEEIKTGILLHREIDSFTDNHPVVMNSKKRLRPTFRHYSPVIVDVFYDHFLASDWHLYEKKDLREFTNGFYALISEYAEIIPEKVNHMLIYMKRDDWLYHYRQKEGIQRALAGMARRTPFDSKMEMAVDYLNKDYEKYKAEFHAFFPELAQHCAEFLKSLK